LRDLEQAIADEEEAAEFHRYLESIAPNAEAREQTAMDWTEVEND
jgi:rubrerythrin